MDLVRALLLGICVAAPIGPVMLFVLEKTLSRGRKWGLVTGIGSAVIDTCYVALCFFALAVAKEFVHDHETVLLMAGGILLVFIGLWLAFRSPARVKEKESRGTTALSYALQAAGCALSNPGALLFAFALVAFFSIGTSTARAPVWLVLFFVFLGEMYWWNFLTYAVVHFKKFSNQSVTKLGHMAGWGICAFGIALIVKGLTLII